METQRILLVDMAETAKRFYALALSSQGYEVVFSPTVTAVAEIVRTCTPALVLVDMKLLGSNPFDLCSTWRSLFALPIILLAERETAIQPAEQRWAISRGATNLLRKHPAQVEELILQLNQLTRPMARLDVPALQAALNGLRQTAHAAPAQASEAVGGLQQLWNVLQTPVTLPAKAPQITDEPGVLRYRGAVIRPPAPDIP